MYQGTNEPPPETTASSAPDARGDLQAANHAASAFNGFASLINEIVGKLPITEGPLPREEGMPAPSPFSYDSLNQQFGTDLPVEGEVNPTEQLNQVKETANAAKESAAEGIRRANTAQSTANSALAKALSAMSVAQQARSIARSAKSSAEADSDAETPPHVRGEDY